MTSHDRDLCTAYGKLLLTELQKNPNLNIVNLMQEGKKSRTKRTKTLCAWALKEMKTLQQSWWAWLPVCFCCWHVWLVAVTAFCTCA